MALVLGMGVGIIVLAFIWIFCLFTALALARAEGLAKFGCVGMLLLAVVITLILWYIPREPPSGIIEDIKIYDYMFIARVTLLTFFSLMVFVGTGFMLSQWLAVPITGKPMRKVKIT
ncbi:transmembrane protein 218-like [Tubulanus polymorphus]|uniref:transmembrane protein 218-like n=1 Tax=Tubulanus polymorphus TaxID=672921 RepID=UPI003DA2AF6F